MVDGQVRQALHPVVARSVSFQASLAREVKESAALLPPAPWKIQ